MAFSIAVVSCGLNPYALCKTYEVSNKMVLEIQINLFEKKRSSPFRLGCIILHQETHRDVSIDREPAESWSEVQSPSPCLRGPSVCL